MEVSLEKHHPLGHRQDESSGPSPWKDGFEVPLLLHPATSPAGAALPSSAGGEAHVAILNWLHKVLGVL